MQRSLLAAAVVLATVRLFGQGQVYFSTYTAGG